MRFLGHGRRRQKDEAYSNNKRVHTISSFAAPAESEICPRPRRAGLMPVENLEKLFWWRKYRARSSEAHHHR
jgi:hypothetical protein